jgi:DNA-binding response OmpR family regulator
MDDTTILIIEGKRADRPSFASDLQKKGFTVRAVSSGAEALACLHDVDPDVVIVNAPSLRSTGLRICQSLRADSERRPIMLITEADQTAPEHAANVILALPFTIQKLANRLKPFSPGDGQNIVHVGPMRLDLEKRRVRCLGKSARITPRLIKILQILLQHHGEVVEREALFTQVWETSYTGDTRTLDVHISWLRRAIELDPEKPRFLKTIRGVGYRLDV